MSTIPAGGFEQEGSGAGQTVWMGQGKGFWSGSWKQNHTAYPYPLGCYRFSFAAALGANLATFLVAAWTVLGTPGWPGISAR